MNLGKNRRDSGGPPEPSNPAVAKARDQIAKGDVDGAATTLRQLLKGDAALPTRSEAAKLLAAAGATADAIATYLDVGRKSLDAGDVAAARSSFAAAHTLDQKSYDALFELGRVDLAEGHKDAALEKFVEVLRKSNLRHLPALYEAAVLYEADGQADQAIAAYKKIAERDRHHVPTLSRLAELYRKKGLLGDALGFYLQGARAAMQSMQYKEARRLVDNALQIEDDNWEARRLQTEVLKADPSGAKAPEAAPAPQRPAPAAAKAVASAPVVAPRPAPAPAAPRPGAQAPPPAAPRPAVAAPAPAAPRPTPPAPVPAVAAPAPVAKTQPTTQPAPTPTVPAPAPMPAATAATGSDMDTDLPAEVTLLEKQSEVTSRLAAIMTEVAEASKKRLTIERDIKAAQAALDALNQQRGTVESNIDELRSQLESVTAAKAAEDRALDDLRSKLEAQRADLEKLAALPKFIADVEAKTTGVATLVSSAAATVESAQKRINEASANAATVEKAAADLTARIAAARAQADEAQEQLKGLLADAKSAKTEAAAAAAGIADVKAQLGALQQLKSQIEAARNDLKTLAPAIEAKRAQIAASVGQLDQRRASRDAQLQAATAAAQAHAPQAPTPQTNGAPAAPTKVVAAPAPKAAPAPQAAPKGKTEPPKADIAALLAAGRVDDAVRTARTSANGSAEPDAAVIEAAERLRESGNAAAAAKACEKLVGVGNNSSSVRYCLALAYVDLKRFKEAMPMFDSLGDPDYGVLRENGIGLCLRGLARADEAAQHFSKALEIPGQPDAQYRDVLYNLADLYESRGDQESLNLAMWSFEEIQAGAPDYRDVTDRIASLKDQLAKIEVPEPNPVLTRDGRGGRDTRF